MATNDVGRSPVRSPIREGMPPQSVTLASRLDSALQWCRQCTAFGLRMHPLEAIGALTAVVGDVALNLWLGLPADRVLPALSVYLTAASLTVMWPRVGCLLMLLYAMTCGWADFGAGGGPGDVSGGLAHDVPVGMADGGMTGGAVEMMLPLCGMWFAAWLLSCRVPWRWSPASAALTVAVCAAADMGPYAMGAVAGGNADHALFALHLTGCVVAAVAGVLTAVGMMLAARAEAERDALRDGERLMLARRNAGFARTLHDTVMNDLSVIAMTADIRLDASREEGDDGAVSVAGGMANGTAQAADARYWTIVRERSNTAWTALRELLDRMRSDDDPQGNAAGFMTALHRECAAFQSALFAAGMTGDVAVVGECHAVAASSAVETLSLIRQCEANVLRYGGGLRRYALRVTVGERDVAVEQSNDVGASVRRADRGGRALAAGCGLALHRQMIEGLGGTLDCGPHNGRWRLQAVIPLHPQAY